MTTTVTVRISLLEKIMVIKSLMSSSVNLNQEKSEILHTVYKTVNILDGKYYIGKHSTSDINDDYLGSGIYLENAIKQHGRKFFKKVVLFVFDNEKAAYDKEAEIVNSDFVKSHDNYNSHVGGTGIAQSVRLFHDRPEYRQKRSDIMRGIPKTEEHKQKISNSHKGKLGHKHSEETKKQIRRTNSRKSYMENWRREEKKRETIADRDRLILEVKTLYDSGVGLREIGRKLDIHHTTVRKYIRRDNPNLNHKINLT